MSSPLSSKTIIVTGASAGIGAATAKALAAEGANVVLTARRADRLESLTAELAHHPGRRLPLAGDIRQETFAHQLIDHAITHFGRLDVLINNAGLGQNSRLDEIPAGNMQTLLNTNILALLYCTQAAVPHMKQQGSGHIINISSIVGQSPLPGLALYCATKTAVNFISRGLRMELRPHHITVTTVYPGRTLTEFGEARLGQPIQSPSRLFQVPAERVAQSIVKAIHTRRPELYVTWYDWLYTHLNRLLPRTADWVFGHRVQPPQQ
jgi:short-subunit dehydrogenase